METPDLLEVELLVPLSPRRTLSVAEHEEWLHGGPAQTRKESEARRVLDILDEIEGERRSA